MASQTSADWRTAYACIILQLGVTLSVALNTSPLLRLLESNVCRHYYYRYDGSDIPESECKVAEIQKRISDLNGTANILGVFPGLLAALFYLTFRPLADGRKLLLINVLGSLVADTYYIVILYFYNIFDPRWMWLKGLFDLIGGGELVFGAFLPASIAESIPHSSLGTFYLYASAAALTIKVLGSAVSLSLMESSLWLPIFLGVGAKVVCTAIFALFLLGGALCTKMTDSYSIPVVENVECDHLLPCSDETLEDTISLEGKWLKLHRDISAWLPQLSICALESSGYGFLDILPYWTSTRYRLTLRETGYINIGDTLAKALIMSLMPSISERLHQSKFGRENNLILVRMCLFFSTLGTILLGFSWDKFSAIGSLIVLAGGSGFGNAYMAHITSGVPKQNIARLYIMLSIVTFIALSISGWAVAGIYSLSLRLGQSWETSVPIWVCSLPFAVAAFYIQ